MLRSSVLALLLFCAPLAAEDPPRVPEEETLALRERIWAGLVDGSAKALEALRVELERKRITVRQAEELIRAGRPYGQEPVGSDVREVKLRYDGSVAEYGLFVPSSYDPARPHALVVELHGTGDTGPHYLATGGWKEIAEKEGFLVAAPTTLRERGQVGTRYGAEIVFETIRDVRASYHVDMDRVYLSGYSRGGHATWWLGILATDRFAGIAPRSGSPKNLLTIDGNKERIWEFFPNVRRLPIYILHGAQDPMVSPEGAHDAVARLKELEADFVFDERDPGGHTIFADRNDELWAYWQEKRRDPIPAKVSWVMNDKLFARGWWISIDEMKSSGGTLEYVIQDHTGHTIERRNLAIHTARATAEVETRSSIRLTTRNCGRVTLRLNDAMLDLDKEVTIWVDGRPERHKFTRSMRTLLETAAERLDPGMTFTVKTTVRVP